MTEHNNVFFTKLPLTQQAVLSSLKAHVKCVFVTGAGGFLGKALCTHLRLHNIPVVGFARAYYPDLEALGVTMYQGDLNDEQALLKAMSGCDIVFHVASKAGVWGSKKSYFQSNVTGTENIINACKVHGINKLIYTSTPSVTFSGVDEEGIDESAPYAKTFLNYYALSKSIAEKQILDCDQTQLKTVALRPHLIWGPGDRHLVPRVLARAKAGRLKLLGKTDKLVDTTYIDNAVYAHLLSALELHKPQPKCAGKVYFISDDEPIFMADMLNKILACQHLPKVTERVPASLAYVFGAILECVYFCLNKQQEPMLTRFVAKQLSTSHYFNISNAKKDLGYHPLINISEGMQHLKKSLNKNPSK
ncbi:3-beta hydroxysteroid dehydrogenase/isomerase [Psychromonas sp. CNPT3]|uniref:2-alkyl-3-oxoalkanoate reductase n=1 Tax=Psychromonas sp. CNPT3 TaxID=314282 RepID=UPI00006E80E3|nr:2-alkyl-3-oxoalkanoate reductase [Psychromonas sp. CNPT3]AGH81113.1 3-beta hydroxysteroid dehydrogenase/isomerase [Psychromonas sp. CNPT3]